MFPRRASVRTRRRSTTAGEAAQGLAHLQTIEGAAFFEPFDDGADFWRAQLDSLVAKAQLSSLAAPISLNEDMRVGAQLLEYLLRIVAALELANADEVDNAAAYWRSCIRTPVWTWIEHGPELWMARIENSNAFPGPLPPDEPWTLWAYLRHTWDHYRRRLLLFKQSMQSKIGALRDILEAELESVGSLRQHVSVLPQLRDTVSIAEWCHVAVNLLHRVPGVVLPASLDLPEGDGLFRDQPLQGRVILEEEPGQEDGTEDRGPRAIPLAALMGYPARVMEAMVGARRHLRTRLRSQGSWQRLQPLSRWRRLAVYGVLSLPLVTPVLYYLSRKERRAAVGRVWTGAAKALEEFSREHVREPVTAIVNELVFAHRTPITDVQALGREKEALRGMLNDYYTEMTELSEAERAERSARYDMTLVTQSYEKSMVTNYNAARSMVTGELVRTLLLQMQFLKVEMMELMRATEILMNENEINMRLMATVPAFLMLGATFWVAKRIFYSTELRMSRPAMVAQLSNLVLDMERFLTLRAGPTLQRVQITTMVSNANSPIRSNSPQWELGRDSSDGGDSPPVVLQSKRPFAQPGTPSQGGPGAVRQPTPRPPTPQHPDTPDGHHALDTRTGSFFMESDAQLYTPSLIPAANLYLPPNAPSNVMAQDAAGPVAPTAVSDYSPWRRVLRARDCGKLLLMAVRLSRVLRENRSRFGAEELLSMQEDLDELVGDRGPMTVGQQLCITQRMMRSYKGLQGQNSTTMDWLRSLLAA